MSTPPPKKGESDGFTKDKDSMQGSGDERDSDAQFNR